MIAKLNPRMAIGLLVIVAKIVAVIALVLLLTQCSPKDSAEMPSGQFSEFDYSLGKSATQSQSKSLTAPQNYNYGHSKR